MRSLVCADDMIPLTPRLEMVASLVPHDTIVADIGTDHAYLPVYLCHHDICASAIAADVAEGPLSAAKAHVRAEGLTERIDCRLSDGLAAIQKGEVQGAVFCGMGGPLIERLLDASPDVVDSLEYLIVQPQSDVAAVRQYFYERDWHITKERIVMDRNRLYEIILAEPGKEAMPEFGLLAVGPDNWKRRDALIPALIENLIEKDRLIYEGLQKSHGDVSERLDAIRRHMNRLEELLCQYHSAK